MSQRGHYLQTYSGLHFYPLMPCHTEIRIRDIAHHLSNLCRFNGAVKTFYSVAQHSVLVSRHCEPENALWGLLHDGSEAYVGDMVRPLKVDMPQYRRVEKVVMASIIIKFGLRPHEPADVKYCDNVLCATEARDLLRRPSWLGVAPYDVFLTNRIKPWSARVAEKRFLARFKELTK